jgi:23S rRNA (guanosine2251-2'-O)-methyltransferase
LGVDVPKSRVIYGFHAVLSRLRQAPASVKEIYLASGRSDQRVRDLQKAAEDRQVRVIAADTARLDGMTGGARHQGVAALAEVRQAASDLDDILDGLSEPALLLALDGVQDPHNLGACLRVADAMGAHAVIAPKDRAVGITPAVEKVASGAVESMPYVMVTNLARTLDALKQREVWVLGAHQDAQQDLFHADLGGALALVIGAEGSGLRRLTQERCDALVRIPMLGKVESLNASVASGMCLFEARRQRESRQRVTAQGGGHEQDQSR